MTLDMISVGISQDDTRSARVVSSWGARLAVTSEVDLWTGTALLRPVSVASSGFPSVASGSANDSAAGSGARTIRVRTVGTALDLQTEDVTLNGVTPVVLTKLALAVIDMVVLTGVANAGVVSATIGGTELCAMAIGAGSSGGGAMYVPVARRVVLVSANVQGEKSVRARLLLSTITAGPARVIAEGYGTRVELVRRGYVVDGPSLVSLRVQATVSTDVGGTLEGVQDLLG